VDFGGKMFLVLLISARWQHCFWSASLGPFKLLGKTSGKTVVQDFGKDCQAINNKQQHNSNMLHAVTIDIVTAVSLLQFL
jgi:hypothetical protein